MMENLYKQTVVPQCVQLNKFYVLACGVWLSGAEDSLLGE